MGKPSILKFLSFVSFFALFLTLSSGIVLSWVMSSESKNKNKKKEVFS
jgi:hypothetical protein